MKRKRGSKKGKSKKRPKVAVNESVVNESVEKVSSSNTEENSGTGDNDNDAVEVDSRTEVETTPLVGADQPEKIASINSSEVVTRPTTNLVYGRMKVKIKSSKAMDPQLTPAEAPTHSDTDKSIQQVGSEKIETLSEKIEDSGNSLQDPSTAVSENPPKKAGSIKIKSSWNSGSSCIISCTAALAQNEETHPKESGVLLSDYAPKEHELKTALEIIKKIMRMDAAEPFNAPVDPVALGIPDYFDVIDTPMDFGTILSNLESGVKYRNSEDVFKDVQYIWNNCFKYNNKGDYVVELMKRVKKNFAKYWMTAGLYTDQPQGFSGADVIELSDAPHSSNGKMHGNSGLKMRKRHGVKRHKDDCLCAICVMMRRRQEREELFRRENSHLFPEGKSESPAESPYGGDTSSNMENSSGLDADSDLEQKGEEMKLGHTVRQYSPMQAMIKDRETELDKWSKGGEMLRTTQLGERSAEKSREFPTHGDMQTIHMKRQHEDRTGVVGHSKPKVLIDKRKLAKIYEDLQRFENPLVLKLCGTLFTNDEKSIWNGPHSLASHQEFNQNSSSIDDAIDSFIS